ncbi:hypothetical protein Q5O14_01865 [Eubacteriaceae bacterium ES2]|nr:hypothetical protein Q5O14_01865 [Eubacteriaceae bacterium ES2]
MNEQNKNIDIVSLIDSDDRFEETTIKRITNADSTLLTPLAKDEVDSVFSPFEDDDFIVNLKPEFPATGSRIRCVIDKYQIDKNQPTKYGMKTSIRLVLNGFYDDDKKKIEINEIFYKNPGEQISGRFRAFCQDLFSALGLEQANLKSLVGRELTAIITYTIGSDGITKWPHLSQFQPLD